jgi:hypothetical protein
MFEHKITVSNWGACPDEHFMNSAYPIALVFIGYLLHRERTKINAKYPHSHNYAYQSTFVSFLAMFLCNCVVN